MDTRAIVPDTPKDFHAPQDISGDRKYTFVNERIADVKQLRNFLTPVFHLIHKIIYVDHDIAQLDRLSCELLLFEFTLAFRSRLRRSSSSLAAIARASISSSDMLGLRTRNKTKLKAKQ